MDPRLLKYYNRELQHLREMAGEFAQEFPKIAGRLSLDGFECADPYVERLLEGFGFLTARIQLKLDAEFPRFTQHLLEMTYPHYLAPTPSMAVVRLEPDMDEGSLAEGFEVPRGSRLRSVLAKGEQTPCEYLTSHNVRLWPLQVEEAEYFVHSRELSGLAGINQQAIKAGFRLRLRSGGGRAFSKLSLNELTLFLGGPGERALRIYEQMHGNAIAVVARWQGAEGIEHEVIPASRIEQVGFEDDEALLPFTRRSFQGYRLLHEYFAFHQRYLFVRLAGLERAVRRCEAEELTLLVLLDRADADLTNVVDAKDFALHCTPAVNLFPKRADRIHVSGTAPEYHLVVDRTRPVDFEVHSIQEVVGHGTGADAEQPFRPFYAMGDRGGDHRAYYTLRREPRQLSSKQRSYGSRSGYVGSEVYLALVDADEAPYRSDLKQLAVRALCTNRDLPLHMPVAQGRTDFTLETGAPVRAIRCVAGPTRPRPPFGEGEVAWKLVSHLSLNYLSLLDDEQTTGAAALHEMLKLYADANEPSTIKQIEGLHSAAARPITRSIPGPGPLAFGRGLEVTLTCDEAAFEGTGVFLLGAVMERFFAKYVSINSFAETVVRTLDRGEIMRWPVRTGRRQML